MPAFFGRWLAAASSSLAHSKKTTSFARVEHRQPHLAPPEERDVVVRGQIGVDFVQEIPGFFDGDAKSHNCCRLNR